MEQSALFTQGGMFKSQSIDPTMMLSVLGGVAFLIIVIIYATYRYKRFRKMQEFTDEMHQLGLNPDEEHTLTQLVAQYAMQEPVDVLMSLRVYDELACQEINRVLGSPGSASAKDNFVKMLYEIRRKTYFPDWNEEEMEAPDGMEANKEKEFKLEDPVEVGA